MGLALITIGTIGTLIIAGGGIFAAGISNPWFFLLFFPYAIFVGFILDAMGEVFGR